MVAAGAVHAQVDERAGMVTFLEDPEQHDSSATAVRIDASIHQCMLLSDRLAALHESVSAAQPAGTHTAPVGVRCQRLCVRCSSGGGGDGVVIAAL
jgi:hypothetical protein